MDKAAIRNFAIWARNKLISDVAYRAGLMGITADGIANQLPQSTNSVQFYDIGTSEPYKITGKEIAQRSNLALLIKRKAKSSDYVTAYTSIIEEVAYTWFNRLIAVRFMEVNDYLPSHIRVLSSESGKIEPDIVTNPFDADLALTETESSKILEFKQNNDADELFKLLFVKQCNKLSEILPRLFEKTDDYTELLFNCSYVDQEGIVYRLTHDINEEDFDVERGGQVEIIGWLYQYYNAELKDDTFALLKKNVKITKERIPSATQLFTPDWIVRYMVENSLGRLWSEGHTNTSSQLRGNWKYYLEETKQEPNVQVQLNDIRKEYAKLHPEDIKLIDPCMGSGHILVYAFDVLMQIYESEGYSQRDAVVQILENNIFGLDIDDRAAQLAYFAVMMKARQYNRRILDGTHDCHVLAIQESNGMSTLQTYMAPFGELSDVALRLISTFIDAKEYGSILSVSLTLDEIDALERRLERIRNNRSDDVEELMVEAMLLNEFPHLLDQARLLVQRYDVVVTNPPYMGASGMNDKLLSYVKERFKDAKSDLSTVFMDRCLSFTKKSGYYAMINIPVWMFISSYVSLRETLIDNATIKMMAHLGRGVFGSDFGTTAFVICNYKIINYKGLYQKLFIKQGEVSSQDEKEKMFFDADRKYYVDQERFLKIPGAPIAYWVSERFCDCFTENTIDHFAEVITGMTIGDNNKYLRLWYEPSFSCLALNHTDMDQIDLKREYWIPYSKGGQRRNWYGNHEYVVNWSKKDSFNRSKTTLKHLYLKDGLTWPFVTMGDFSARILPSGFLWDVAGSPCFFIDDNIKKYTLSFLCSKVANYILRAINPTINVQAIDIARMPLIVNRETQSRVIETSNNCIELSKCDWNSFETSWDFKRHPLI